MAFGINTVAVTGGLVRDCRELIKVSPSGVHYGTVSVGFNTSRKNQSGEWEDKSNYLDVKVVGKQAEFLMNNGLKGLPVAIEGSLSQERWEKDGEKRSRLVIEAKRVQLFARPNSEGQAARPTPAQGGFPNEIPFS